MYFILHWGGRKKEKKSKLSPKTIYKVSINPSHSKNLLKTLNPTFQVPSEKNLSPRPKLHSEKKIQSPKTQISLETQKSMFMKGANMYEITFILLQDH